MVQLAMQMIIKLYCFLLLVVAVGVKPVLAQSITTANDGAGTVIDNANESNQYDISGGTQAGSNLFHSFEQFGLEQGQIANFLSNADTENILGRVVGGEASVIDGLLQMSGGQSNLYLMNPAGILFGANAQLNLAADFTATTANGIQLGDGWFNAMGTNEYAQLVSSPSGFAFTNNNPGVVVNAGDLAVSAGADVTLLGGLVVNTGTVETEGGNITIASVPGDNLVSITPDGSLLSLELPVDVQGGLNAASQTLTTTDLPSLLSGGSVAQQDLGIVVEDGVVKIASTNTTIPTSPGTTIVSGQLDVADETANGAGGAIDVLGERVGLVEATLMASGANGGGDVRIGGDYQGQGPVPNAELTYISQDSTIVADALTTGNGGQVIIWADDSTEFYGNISAHGGSLSGDGGFVEVSGHENLAFHGQVNVSATDGAHGTLLLDPRNIFIVEGDSGASDREFDDGQVLASNNGSLDFSISANVLEQQQGRIVLQANENIEIDPGISLTFLPGNDGQGDSIIFQADYDRNGSGDFLMDPGQSIKALSRDLSISAIYIETGDIESEGLNLRASLNGHIITGELVTTDITRLEADEGDIIAENISTEFSFNSFGVNGEVLEGSTISASRPLVSIKTNGLVRIINDRGIGINVSENRVIEDLDIFSLSDTDIEQNQEARMFNELLSIRHGGETEFLNIFEQNNSNQVVVQGGGESFGFVVNTFALENSFPEGVSGVHGPIELSSKLDVSLQEFNNGTSVEFASYDSRRDLFSVANADTGTPSSRVQQSRPRTTARNILDGDGGNTPVIDGSVRDGDSGPIGDGDSGPVRDGGSDPIGDGDSGPVSDRTVEDGDNNSVNNDGNNFVSDGGNGSVSESEDNANNQNEITTKDPSIEESSFNSGEDDLAVQEGTDNSREIEICSSFESTGILDISLITPEECQGLVGQRSSASNEQSLKKSEP